MRSWFIEVTIAVIAAGTLVSAQGRGAHADKGRTVSAPVVQSHAESPTRVQVTFSSREIAVIRTHYASQGRTLPRGLQKKLARGGSLPPGWQKKFEPFPAAIERDLIVLPAGRRRGVIDGHAVIFDAVTHAILDIVSIL